MSSPRLPRNLIVGIIVLLAIGFTVWHFLRPSAAHPGISYGNGRLEATEVDVATKVAGRVAEAGVMQARDGVASASSQQKLGE